MNNNIAITIRPRKLEDVFNQDSVIKELKQRMLTKDWPLAMLLKGPTGTGKSTVGQIIAMTINCSHPHADGTPCGECASCQSIISERFDRDTVVLDGSTLGVKDDVISFGQIAEISPMYDKNKILIIEESDQLSTAAKNALHKILEKPRKNVHFILLSMATSGLPASIQSRCQTYNFKYFDLPAIALGLKTTMEKLGLWADSSIPDTFRLEGLMVIASASKGSFREALQMLEKCLTGQYFTRDEIRTNLGIIDNVTITNLLTKFLDRDNSFFEWFSSVDYNEFFNLGYSSLVSALVYRETKFIENEWFADIIKTISGHSRLKESIVLFDSIYENSSGSYLKKSYFFSKLAQSFSNRTAIVQTPKDVPTPPSWVQNQTILDAKAKAHQILIQSNEPNVTNTSERVEVTNLSHVPTRTPRGLHG